MKFTIAIIFILIFWGCNTGIPWMHGIVLNKDTKQPLENVEMRWLGDPESGFKIKDDGRFGYEIYQKWYEMDRAFVFSKNGYQTTKQKLTGNMDTIYLEREKQP